METAAGEADYSVDGASKRIVSALTNLVNFFFPPPTQASPGEIDPLLCSAPTSIEDLSQRIQDDYLARNYLWTGDIDYSSFDKNCKFTDPTISFQGRETFRTNTANLKVLVDLLTKEGDTKSKLLAIQQNQRFVQTRWNMVGTLSALPWKPKIDVVGNTKFWFAKTADGKNYQVTFYDESWEIPASQALLQLVTPSDNRDDE